MGEEIPDEEAKKSAKIQSPGKKDKGKSIMVSKKKDSPPGSIVHVIEEKEEEPDSINPNQFQKMAKTTYESHLKKIEVISLDSFRNFD